MFWKFATKNEEVELNCISEKSPIKPHPATVDMEKWEIQPASLV